MRPESPPQLKSRPIDRGEEVSLSPAQWLIVEALKTHENSLKRTIWAYLRSLLSENRAAIESEWEDVLADTREKALRNAHLYDPQKSVGAWLDTIAFNCVRDLRRKRRQEVLAQDAALFAGGPYEDKKPDENDVFDHLQENLTPPSHANDIVFSDLLPLIAPNYHDILAVHFKRGLRGKALAAELGLSEGAAAVKLCRAKDAFEIAYRKFHLSEDRHEQ